VGLGENYVGFRWAFDNCGLVGLGTDEFADQQTDQCNMKKMEGLASKQRSFFKNIKEKIPKDEQTTTDSSSTPVVEFLVQGIVRVPRRICMTIAVH
jgi:hypothetical protein